MNRDWWIWLYGVGVGTVFGAAYHDRVLTALNRLSDATDALANGPAPRPPLASPVSECPVCRANRL